MRRSRASRRLFSQDYTFSPGAIIYIDGGTYNLTKNMVLTSAYSGIAFQGPTSGTTATFNRQGTTSGFYDFEVNGAKNLRFSNLTITGGDIGLMIDDNSGSTGVTLDSSVVIGNNTDVQVGAGADGFTLTNSTLGAQNSTNVVYVNAAANVTIAKNTFNLGFKNTGFGNYDLNIVNSANSIVQDNTFVGGSGTNLLAVASSTNVLIAGNSFSGSSNYLASIVNSTGLVNSNTFDSGQATHGLAISGVDGTAPISRPAATRSSARFPAIPAAAPSSSGPTPSPSPIPCATVMSAFGSTVGLRRTRTIFMQMRSGCMSTITACSTATSCTTTPALEFYSTIRPRPSKTIRSTTTLSAFK